MFTVSVNHLTIVGVFGMVKRLGRSGNCTQYISSLATSRQPVGKPQTKDFTCM